MKRLANIYLKGPEPKVKPLERTTCTGEVSCANPENRTNYRSPTLVICIIGTRMQSRQWFFGILLLSVCVAVYGQTA